MQRTASCDASALWMQDLTSVPASHVSARLLKSDSLFFFRSNVSGTT